MRPVKVTIYTPHELNQSSVVRTGLYELEQKGLIKLKVVCATKPVRGRILTTKKGMTTTDHHYKKVSFYRIEDGNKTVDFSFDGYDIAEMFPISAIQKCERVYKRNYIDEEVSRLSEDLQKKISPFGLAFMVRHPNENIRKLKWGYYLSNLRYQKIDRTYINRLRSEFRSWKNQFNNYMRAPELDHYKVAQAERTRPYIFFQTRLFPEGNESDAHEINEQRAVMIRALKKQFGPGFRGGFIPTEDAKARFPDCITAESTDPVDYLKLIQGSSIAIYSRGLSRSPAWKLGQYLGMGKCIVADRMPTRLMTDLEDKKSIHWFDRVDECIEICKELMNNPEEIRNTESFAREYYDQNVRPDVKMKKIIEELTGKPLSEK